MVLLSVYTFYVSSPVLIPLTLAVLITMLLSPVIGLLDRLKIPRALSAAAAIAVLAEILCGGAYGLSAPLSNRCRNCPKARKIDLMLRSIKKPFAQIEQATERLSSRTEHQNANAPRIVQFALPSLTERVAGALRSLRALHSHLRPRLFSAVVCYTFLRKLVSVIPTFADKKRAVETISNI